VWHERLELMIPLDHPVRFAMGNKVVELNPGDLLLVDNMQHHAPVDLPAEDTRIIVLSFLPEFVYSLGSPSHDYLLLLPFYAKRTENPLILQAQAVESSDACHALDRLVDCYSGTNDRPLYRAGCKAFLLELLYHLARHFRQFSAMKHEFERQRERAHKLQGLLEHISQHYPEPYTVEGAARFANLSPSQFMRAFKKVAGMTLIAYVNHVRLSNAARLLRETQLSIAEVAAQTGFADQSYFDKRFKASFGVSPTEYRQGL
jgi:AraC-like DNA-binding protein